MSNLPKPGHASNDLRDGFEQSIETWVRSRRREVPTDLRALAGRLWNCSDIVPGWIPQELDIEAGTFALAGPGGCTPVPPIPR